MAFCHSGRNLARLAVHSLYRQQVRAGSTSARDLLRKYADDRYDPVRQEGNFPPERIITSRQGAGVSLKGSEGRILNFCSNNYLGLCNHPDLIQAGKDFLDKRGVGVCSVRLGCGVQDIHKELENKLAEFHGTEDAVLFLSCYDANMSVFDTLLTKDDVVIQDELNHASIIDGVRLSRAQRRRYKHRNMEELEDILKECKDFRIKMVATDGVFSMDGTVAPLQEICDLADKYGAVTFLDESHSAGLFGKTGRGTPEYTGTMGRIDLINSTLGKAFGGASGGYTAGPNEVINTIRQLARHILYSNTLAPPLVGSALKALEIIMSSNELLEKAKENITLFRTRMADAGFTLGGNHEHPISPVFLYDSRLSRVFADELLKEGIMVYGVSFPVVPKGTARIRVVLSAQHTTEEINKCIDAFIVVGKRMKVIS